MEVNIKITLTDGTSYKLKPKEKLGKINPSKKAIFMFNNLEFYEGYTSGDILDDGETEYFTIRKEVRQSFFTIQKLFCQRAIFWCPCNTDSKRINQANMTILNWKWRTVFKKKRRRYIGISLTLTMSIIYEGFLKKFTN